MSKKPPQTKQPTQQAGDQNSSAGNSSAGKSSSGIGAVVLHHTVTALMLALIIALGVWTYLTFRKTSFFQPADGQVDSRVEAFALDAQMQRIRFALGVYFRFDGRYPAELDDLVERGLLLPSDLYYPSGTGRYTYRRTASGYTLDLQAQD